MILLTIIILILLLALLRVGVILQYNAEGTVLWLKIGFFKIKLNPDEEKKPKRGSRFKIGSMKPGSAGGFIEILKVFKEILGRVRRRLLIKKLIIHYTSAGDDPAKTALMYGAANALFGAVIPPLERHFRIKKRDLRAYADFEAEEQGVYALISISIAIWESLYIASAVLPLLKGTSKTQAGQKIQDDKKVKVKKGKVDKNGERTDKQPA